MNKRLLIINVYFAPRSFGGATIIAEAMAELLSKEHGWQILVLTTMSEPQFPPYTILRYQSKGISIIGVNTPDDLTYEEKYNNQAFTVIAEKIIHFYKPSVIQAHCVQSMGCGVFPIIKQMGIPVAVTVHDCWWICERQFMINGQGAYCFQKKIDFRQCSYCVDDPDKAAKRYKYLHETLNNVDLLLFPSEFHKNLYLENGFDTEKCLTNKNGVKLPDKKNFRKRTFSDNRVRFGFVGGSGPIKGANLIVDAFSDINKSNYEIIIVDAAKIIGRTWKDSGLWDLSGKVNFIPPYSMNEMDNFYSNIDVLLFPSQWKESFGLVVREAMARDVWVITTEAGGVVEDIESGINGHVIPLDGDYRKLKDCIVDCLGRQNWKAYKNPLKEKIRGVDEQASELSSILYQLANR